ncbi:MAG TPA: STAS domain-containing protein [bacterium]|nr:STAS domain-containing protein [Candidatus Omnitrophota bacterium]HOJ61470.1 STAS domain-containing protein [bacterium]HOL94504.1 STAS domain-containing protein [bacterium]HPP00642.1 STAS domain-containing protein [bacterium]HXK93203.1 STAS domain-containing protein [bacterium]
MAIWHEQLSSCFVIHVEEPELTEEILDRMRQVLTVAFLSRQYNLVLDLSSCVMVDSYFIGLLISTYREVKELGGSLLCVGLSGQVDHAFEVIRLNQVVDIFDTVEEAVRHLNQKNDPPAEPGPA